MNYHWCQILNNTTLWHQKMLIILIVHQKRFTRTPDMILKDRSDKVQNSTLIILLILAFPFYFWFKYYIIKETRKTGWEELRYQQYILKCLNACNFDWSLKFHRLKSQLYFLFFNSFFYKINLPYVHALLYGCMIVDFLGMYTYTFYHLLRHLTDNL